MIVKAFAVYDTKALNYGMPFFMSSTGGAVRAFGDLANDKQSSISKHPSDYVLFEIGTFDDSKGELKMCSPLRNLGMGSDFLPTSPIADNVIKETNKIKKEVLQ